MRILFISHFVPYPPHGGALQRNFNLLKETAKKNEIHLLTLTQKVLLPSEEKLRESIMALIPHCMRIEVFKIPTDYSKFRWFTLLFFNLFSLTPYSVWRFRSRAMIREIKKQLKQNRFDLVHFDTVDLAQYARYIPFLPKVLNHHNVESTLLLRRAANEKNLLSKLYLFLQGRKLRRYEAKVIPAFDSNIVVSDLDKIEFRKFAPQARFEVVSNGTDTEYFKPVGNFTPNNLIFVGGLTWYPNRDAMLYFCGEIFPLIKKKVPGVKMHMIGRLPRTDIRKITKENDSIISHGYVEDIRPYLTRAAVYVVPLRVGGGTRLKILDAMAMGKAIVSTSIGCEGLRVTEGKNILIVDGPRKFADKVIDILGSPVLREHLGRNARDTVLNHYSWGIISASLEKIYREFVSRD